MDKKLVANVTQPFEIDYVANKFNAPRDVVQEIADRVGVSRRKVYAELRAAGYNNKPRQTGEIPANL